MVTTPRVPKPTIPLAAAAPVSVSSPATSVERSSSSQNKSKAHDLSNNIAMESMERSDAMPNHDLSALPRPPMISNRQMTDNSVEQDGSVSSMDSVVQTSTVSEQQRLMNSKGTIRHHPPPNPFRSRSMLTIQTSASDEDGHSNNIQTDDSYENNNSNEEKTPEGEEAGSQGSFIVRTPQSTNTSNSATAFNFSSQHQRTRQDRFPSFDSMASTGSFFQVSQRSLMSSSSSHGQITQQQNNKYTQQQHNTWQQQQQQPPVINMTALPYHVRRTLMEQRRNDSSQTTTQQQQSPPNYGGGIPYPNPNYAAQYSSPHNFSSPQHLNHNSWMAASPATIQYPYAADPYVGPRTGASMASPNAAYYPQPPYPPPNMIHMDYYHSPSHPNSNSNFSYPYPYPNNVPMSQYPQSQFPPPATPQGFGPIPTILPYAGQPYAIPPPPPPPTMRDTGSPSSLEHDDEEDDSLDLEDEEHSESSTAEHFWQRDAKPEQKGNFFMQWLLGLFPQKNLEGTKIATMSEFSHQEPRQVDEYDRKNQYILQQAWDERANYKNKQSNKIFWGNNHQRLPSIQHDNWDADNDTEPIDPMTPSHERTHLLPPSGISSKEEEGAQYLGYDSTPRPNLRTGQVSYEDRRNAWILQQQKQLQADRETLMRQWESQQSNGQSFKKSSSQKIHDDGLPKFLRWMEAFIANLPLTIGAIALSFANLGVIWFKFTEETLESCEPVHFHSSQCTFPEFPGCFYCDTHNTVYRVALTFHEVCSFIAGTVACTFFFKLILARRVVFDELRSPTTAAPAGLICMTCDIVFAGRGLIGEIAVLTASGIHFCLAVWFIYMALAYHIMPEPSWFPNTVSIGISAVKTWLYFPMAGHFLMAVSLSLSFLFFPISLIRVALNRKISATVGWMQMTAPNISLYAMTLMAQPSFSEEHPDVTRFQIVHRMVYLPLMHFLFGLCILGMCASVTSLVVRWKEFSKLPFSPAHAAFCAPTLSHANAIQAYRGAVDAFSTLKPGSPLKILLFCYWVFWLLAGTIVTLVIAFKFFSKLPEWTHIDTSDEIEPPQPSETAMITTHLLATGETLRQSFVSPAILQANETGALVVSRNQEGDQVYRRTRKVTALGFEPIMSDVQMDLERHLLLEWVAQNPPRRRHRTLSGIENSVNGLFASAGVGEINPPQRNRANTLSPYVLQKQRKTSMPVVQKPVERNPKNVD